MERIYLKKNEKNGYAIELDYGNVYAILLLGILYPIRKKHYWIILPILLTEVFSCLLVLLIIPIEYSIYLCVLLLFITRLLFVYNYNMIVIEHYIKNNFVPITYESCDKLLKKGIYFTLK